MYSFRLQLDVTFSCHNNAYCREIYRQKSHNKGPSRWRDLLDFHATGTAGAWKRTPIVADNGYNTTPSAAGYNGHCLRTTAGSSNPKTRRRKNADGPRVMLHPSAKAENRLRVVSVEPNAYGRVIMLYELLWIVNKQRTRTYVCAISTSGQILCQFPKRLKYPKVRINLNKTIYIYQPDITWVIFFFFFCNHLICLFVFFVIV